MNTSDDQQEGQSAPPGDEPNEIRAALTPQQVRRLGQWGVTKKPGILRAWSGRCSPRHAIKMNCLECMGEVEQDIADCSARTCPLWHFRPFQHKRSV